MLVAGYHPGAHRPCAAALLRELGAAGFIVASREAETGCRRSRIGQDFQTSDAVRPSRDDILGNPPENVTRPLRRLKPGRAPFQGVAMQPIVGEAAGGFAIAPQRQRLNHAGAARLPARVEEARRHVDTPGPEILTVTGPAKQVGTRISRLSDETVRTAQGREYHAGHAGEFRQRLGLIRALQDSECVERDPSHPTFSLFDIDDRAAFSAQDASIPAAHPLRAENHDTRSHPR